MTLAMEGPGLLLTDVHGGEYFVLEILAGHELDGLEIAVTFLTDAGITVFYRATHLLFSVNLATDMPFALIVGIHGDFLDIPCNEIM